MFKAYQERKVLNPATPLADMIDTLADLPLVYHPGTSWEYSVATDVVGRLVEVVSGDAVGQVHPAADFRSARHGGHRLRGAGKGPQPARRLLRRGGPDGSDEAGPDPHR